MVHGASLLFRRGSRVSNLVCDRLASAISCHEVGLKAVHLSIAPPMLLRVVQHKLLLCPPSTGCIMVAARTDVETARLFIATKNGQHLQWCMSVSLAKREPT